MRHPIFRPVQAVQGKHMSIRNQKICVSIWNYPLITLDSLDQLVGLLEKGIGSYSPARCLSIKSPISPKEYSRSTFSDSRSSNAAHSSLVRARSRSHFSSGSISPTLVCVLSSFNSKLIIISFLNQNPYNQLPPFGLYFQQPVRRTVQDLGHRLFLSPVRLACTLGKQGQ